MTALVFVIGIGLYVLSATLATGGRGSRSAALVVAIVALAVPYALPHEWRLVRSISAMASFLATTRIVDLVVRRERTPWFRRVIHCFTVADSFRVRRTPPSIEWRSMQRLAIFSALAVVGWWLAFDVARSGDRIALRWLGGLLSVYGITEVAYTAVYAGYRAAGFTPPLLHRDPALARSVREFWGRRWNRIVGAWFDARIFRPHARRGKPMIGMALTFSLSTLLHAYVTHVALGVGAALVMSAFFVVQGGIAVLEGPLGVARWRPAFGHLWTVIVMGGTSPLFCEPFLRVVG